MRVCLAFNSCFIWEPRARISDLRFPNSSRIQSLLHTHIRPLILWTQCLGSFCLCFILRAQSSSPKLKPYFASTSDYTAFHVFHILSIKLKYFVTDILIYLKGHKTRQYSAGRSWPSQAHWLWSLYRFQQTPRRRILHSTTQGPVKHPPRQSQLHQPGSDQPDHEQHSFADC